MHGPFTINYLCVQLFRNLYNKLFIAERSIVAFWRVMYIRILKREELMMLKVEREGTTY